MSEDLHIAGAPRLEVDVSADLPNGSLVALVYDIDGSGGAMVLTRGAHIVNGTQSLSFALGRGDVRLTKRRRQADGRGRTPAPAAVSTTDPPTTERFYGFDRHVLNRIPPNPVTGQVPRSEGGFLSNQQIAYLTTRFARRSDGRELLVYRAKAPTAPDTRAGEKVTDPFQVRYWSVCQNEFVSQRFVECVADYEAALGGDGYFTVVVSDPEDRPVNATEANHVNWLPWGGAYYDGLLIYRHMLPAPAFAQAVQRVPEGTPPASVMGEYFPRVRYCSKETFEQGGAAACLS